MERKRGAATAAPAARGDGARGPLDGAAAAAAFGDPVRLMETALLRVPVFPLAGALLFPGSQLPLHIFEPRYRTMIRDALASDKLIAMIQPRPGPDGDETPALFDIGCIGRIDACEE